MLVHPIAPTRRRAGSSTRSTLFLPAATLGPELQASGGTRLDAGGLEPLSDAVRAQRALVDLLRGRVESRDIERAPRHAVLAADAVLLLEVDDPVRVLHDCAVGRAGAKTS